MTYNEQERRRQSSTSKIPVASIDRKNEGAETVKTDEFDPLSALESDFQTIEQKHPRLMSKETKFEARSGDLRAILEISKAINSTLVLDDILQMVMKRAIELLQAERGYLMLLDESDELQFKTVHNIQRDALPDEELRISRSIANEVVKTGRPVFASDAQADERFAKQKSILELHLRSIMCVPLKIKDKIIGVVYLDNSSDAKIFLQSDLYLFELFAEQAAIAIENAKLYESLLKLKHYNENVVDATPVGIIALDRHLNVTTLNSAAAEILSGSGAKPVRYDPQSSPISFMSLWPESSRRHWEKVATGVLTSGKKYQDSKYYHQLGDEQKVLSLKISLLDEGAGDQSGVIVVIEDITEKAVLENYVLMSERLVAKGEMAASIGHELNNYLTIISNNAELLKLNVKRGSLEKLDRNVTSIFSNIDKIKRFTNGLMDFSKLEADFVGYEVKNLIEELLFSIKPHKTLKDITLDVDIPSDLPTVEMDVGQMHQVLLNLINNAIEAIGTDPPRPGRLHIAVVHETAHDQISIEISDNGPGIEVADLEKVFEPRFTTKKKGHGLGLSNCRRIVESHSGTITAISDGADGATFRIVLPVRQPQSNFE